MSPSTTLLVRQILIGFLIMAFFGMLLISIWYGTRVDSFTIDTVTVRGGETIEHKQIEEIVRNQLAGAYLKFVPRAFAFTYPAKDIEASILNIKRIKDLTIVRENGTALTVEFTEYVPHALWCGSSDSEGCFFLDENGYSFSPAPSLSGGSFLRLVSIAKDPAEDVQAFSTEDYKKVHELTTLFADAGWYIGKAELDATGDAFFTIVDGGEFKVSLRQSAQETVDNMLTVLNSEKFEHIQPGNFEYVDLRFGSKVFVNEVTLTTPTSTATSSQHSPSESPMPTEDTAPATPVFAEEEADPSTAVMMIPLEDE